MSKRADPANLTHRALASLINSAEPGTITPGAIQYHINSSSYPLGPTGSRLSLLWYAAWLRRRLAEGRRLKTNGKASADIMRERRAEARDIGPIPDVVNAERREACRLDPAKFGRTYLPGTFSLPFSKTHLQVIDKGKRSVLRREKYALGVFRGFGKSSLAELFVLWGALFGHLRFIPIIGPEKGHAVNILESLLVELTYNAILRDDFPEVCKPIEALEGISQRCAGQTYTGKDGKRRPTMIGYGEDHLVLPTIEGSKASGVVVKAYGLTGSLRGMKHRRPDGQVIRPDWVLLDDPQTDASAKSPAQCSYREDLINGAISGLGGHLRKLGGLCCCTIIRKDDLADRLLDRERHPEWSGDVFPMLIKPAKKEADLWLGEYASLRRNDYRDDEGGRDRAVKEATAFYRKRRKEMDAGAVVAWEEARSPEELSGIQHAYNCFIDWGEAAFRAECQLDPVDPFEGTTPPLEARDILAKLNRLKLGVCPAGSSAVVAFADCGKRSHVHYMVCAFGDGYAGAIIDHGIREVAAPFGGVEAALSKTLKKLVDELLARTYPVEGGAPALRIERFLVDSGWKTSTIYEFCRWAGYRGTLLPSKGQGSDRELRIPKKLPRRYWGPGWYHAPTLAAARSGRNDQWLTMYETDLFKSIAAERLRTPLGGAGSLSIDGDPRRRERFRDLAEQLTSERASEKERRNGDRFDKWRVIPGRSNHLWDCLVGCLVAAAYLGIKPPQSEEIEKAQKATRRRRRGGGFRSV
jgi:hypothetical protein